MNLHHNYINRCIQLAANGLGTTYPNPMVGSVIVYDNKIIGEGWHQKPGGPHAEVVAINSVQDKSLLEYSTLYVNLEPCSHFGRTPPCSDLIIDSKIPNVVVGTVDPHVKIAGKGIEKLFDAGVNVTVGVLEKECRFLNRRFFSFHQKKRPYIILKWAQTNDGFIAPAADFRNKNASPIWISNAYSRQLVHKWRSEEQAILIGTQTAVDDNPKLDVRDWTGANPIRIVLDRSKRISKENHIFGLLAKTMVVSEGEFSAVDESLAIDFGKNLAEQLCELMYIKEILSVIIEGGRQTLQTFIDAGLWDEARVFTGTNEFGNGVKAPLLPVGASEKMHVGSDELKIYLNHD
ncbi:MAG TPA: bifunctional diaminohydroxyphosphoribosylaminopyrimidine deaminase/5-amino-6-(5-phosphoribosylamino)uracil reductase RibD [Flavobacterium sp.]|nr:bifunctional diaminohydroxyphosphoribosylaminopyrimidine deaminase/5-amino-6-(5-phosphoribosylamino)uracil reductase RibD [Flavobacterium sp.]